MPAPSTQGLEAALAAGRDPENEVVALFESAETLDRDGQRALLRALEVVLRGPRPERLGEVALLAGAIVENGAEPSDLGPAVYDRIAEWMETVPDDEASAAEFELPEAFYLFERAAMAALSRSSELRRTLPQKAIIQSRLRRYDERYGFTNKVLSVLDDEPILVVHRPTNRVWRCRVAGIADNFQLHTLLLGALAGRGDEAIAGERPSKAALLAASNGDPGRGGHVESDWQLANWTALRPGGEISDEDVDHWIWNEGYPAEIAAFNGTRVILIDSSIISRSWNADRIFDAMHGSLQIETRLPDAEAGPLIDEMTRAAAT